MSKLLQLYIGGVRRNDYSITWGGYAQMITILHRGGGVSRDPRKWLRNMCTTPKMLWTWRMMDKLDKRDMVWHDGYVGHCGNESHGWRSGYKGYRGHVGQRWDLSLPRSMHFYSVKILAWKSGVVKSWTNIMSDVGKCGLGGNEGHGGQLDVVDL